MLAPMMIVLALVGPAQAPDLQGTPAPQQPPIQVSLNNDGRYGFGEPIRVRVRPADDGFLVVLRTDVHGWVRVLYPPRPSADDFVRGGRDLDISGPQGGDAFEAGPSAGTGTIVAARAREAFHFDRYVTANHWNYRALDSATSAAAPESALVSIVQSMAGDVHFDYDVAQYSVADPEASTAYAGRYGDPAYGDGYPSPYWSYPYWPYAWWPYDPFFFGFYAAGFYPSFFGCYGCYRGYGFYVGRGFGFGRPYGRAVPYRPRAYVGTGVRARPSEAAPAFRGSAGRRYIPSTGVRGAPSYGGAPRGYARSYGGGRGAYAAPRGGGGGSYGRSGGGGGGRRGR